MVGINLWAVLLAALAFFLLGGLWYSLLFAKQWQRAAGVSDEQLASGAPRVFGGALLLSLIAAAGLAFFIGAEGLVFGTLAGLATGLLFVTAAFWVTYLFERRPIALFLINGGYNTVAFTGMGAIIGALQAT